MSESERDRKSTRLNSSHTVISYAVFCLKKKNSSERAITRTLKNKPEAELFARIALRLKVPRESILIESQSTNTFFFYWYGDHRDLHSFPTRRSSDLSIAAPCTSRSATVASPAPPSATGGCD